MNDSTSQQFGEARTRRYAGRVFRLLFSVSLTLFVVAYWPFACKSPPPHSNLASTPSASGLERSTGSPSLLPHPAFALADSSQTGGSARVSIADIAERVTPSVVSISSEREVRERPSPFGFPFFRGLPPSEPRMQSGLGSGVIVSADGIVLTNNHVIDGASEIRVIAADGREFGADLKGADEKSDLAVLQLRGDIKDLQALPLGDSARLRLGDIVLAVGNPFGIGQTVTMGIVSAKGRADVGIVDYEDFIQTDAAINPGNSGGALVDMEGNLVGINTAILSRSGGYQGIGFAIPSNMARPIMDSLVEHGRVVRGFLGVGIQELNHELLQAMDLSDVSGVLISSVQRGSAAGKAGVQHGDIVTAVDGVPVSSTGQLRNLIAGKGAQKEVTLEILRNKKKLKLKVVLGELPSAQAPADEPNSQGPGALGLQLTELTAELAERLGSERKRGVVVADVAPGSAAARAGLRRGDIVVEVNRKQVTNPAEVEQLAKKNGETLLFLIERQGQTRYLAVER